MHNAGLGSHRCRPAASRPAVLPAGPRRPGLPGHTVRKAMHQEGGRKRARGDEETAEKIMSM